MYLKIWLASIFLLSSLDASISTYKKKWIPLVTSDIIVVVPYSNKSIGKNTIDILELTSNSAKISWLSDEYEIGEVEYGETTEYGDFSTDEVGLNNKKHIYILSDLESNTVYHCRVVFKGKDGNSIFSKDVIFKTLPQKNVDTAAPVITLKGSNPVTITEGKNYSESGATAKDDVDGSVKVTILGSVNSAKIGSYTITYIATDKAGNQARITRIVNVKSSDTTPPVIKWWNGDSFETVVKQQNNLHRNLIYIRSGYSTKANFTGAIAVDDRDGKIPVVISGIDYNKPGKYNVAFTATDKAGNKTVKYWAVTLLAEDTTPPKIIFPKGKTVTVKDSDRFDLTSLGIYSMDDRSGRGSVELREVSKDGKKDFTLIFELGSDLKDGRAKAGVYTLLYRAFDKAGNKTTDTMTLVIKDGTPPRVSIVGSSTIRITKGQKYTEAGATARDNKDGNVKVTISGSVNTNKVGTYILTYAAVDKAGNKAVKKRTVIVEETPDRIAPVITLYGDAVMTIIQGDKYFEQHARALDNKDDGITVSESGTVDTSKVGTYTRIYTAVDKAGNKSTKKRIIHVVAPSYNVISSLKGNVLTVKWSGFPKEKIYENSIVLRRKYPSSGWSYPLDKSSGQQSLSLEQDDHKDYRYTITMQGPHSKVRYTKEYIMKSKYGPIPARDVTRPVIMLNGKEMMKVAIHSVFVDPGATAIDNKDGKVTVTTRYLDTKEGGNYRIGKVNTNVYGSYKIFYEAQDKAGNKALKIRYVYVMEEPTIVISSIIDNKKTIEAGSYTKDYFRNLHAYGVSSESHENRLPVKLIDDGQLDTNKVGTYYLTYATVDSKGNRARKTITVYIVGKTDRHAPDIMLNGSNSIEVKSGNYTELGATATDDVDKNIKVTISYGSGIEKGLIHDGKPGSKQGLYLVIYTAKDSAGHVTHKYRKVYVDLASWYLSYEIVNNHIRARYPDF